MSDFMHRYMIMRRCILVFTLALTWFVVDWSMSYADGQTPNLEVAAVIAAVAGPVTLLLGWVTKTYAENPYQDGDK